MAALFVVAPGDIVDRLQSTFNAQDPTNQDRFAMLEIGARIIRDHPMTGVGPNMVSEVYEQYRPDYAVNPSNPHLHNVPMHIAAERGLPALAVWMWCLLVTTRGLVARFYERQTRSLAAAGLAAIAGMLAAGMFEYNFGDSEFLMLFLVLITLPHAAASPSPSRPVAARLPSRNQHESLGSVSHVHVRRTKEERNEPLRI